MGQISSILIANRGEIAVRIIRTARNLGIRTIAVYSDADKNAPHVKLADDSVHIGAAPVGASYLRADKILDAAKVMKADAIHPGYGFLSENSGFAKACQEAGLIFIGPPTNAIDIMGDKAKSKRAMLAAGVPCVPGYQGEDQSDATLIKEAKKIGFPLLVKAAAGGGGRGMRLVEQENDLESAITLARSEAENAFGSGELIIERAVQKPRHVEIQVFADAHGSVIHLGERDCSVQRRYQKVLEEAPCPVMTPELRAKMGEAAVQAARAVDYRNAGTVEFLLGSDNQFYFLEMNTRLQVEHPVTEAVTGLDLVALQIKVAEGGTLNLTQDDITLTGHAIEARLYAEDPDNDFMPSTGDVALWYPPCGEGIRVDAGVSSEVSPFYDAMVAKIIAYGPRREDARRRLVKALSQTALIGPKTNRDFLINALCQPAFINGEATTAFIGEAYSEKGYVNPDPTSQDYAIAAVIQFKLVQSAALSSALPMPDELLGWDSMEPLGSRFIYTHQDAPLPVHVIPHGHEAFTASLSGETYEIIVIEMADNRAVFEIAGAGLSVIFSPNGAQLHVSTPTLSFNVVNQVAGAAATAEAGNSGTVTAPMHGQLLDIFVNDGQSVKKGDTLAVLEAMKMQHEIIAEIDGTVANIMATAHTQIAADDLIMEIEAEAED